MNAEQCMLLHVLSLNQLYSRLEAFDHLASRVVQPSEDVQPLEAMTMPRKACSAASLGS